MQTLRVSLALVFACAAQAQSTKTAKIEQIFQLTNMDSMQKKTVEQMMTAMTAQAKQMGSTPQALQSQKEIMQLVMDRMSWKQMAPLYVKAYDETFNEDEISGLLLFYQSAAGKAFTQKMPVLTGKMIAISQQRMMEIAPEIRKKAEAAAQQKTAKP